LTWSVPQQPRPSAMAPVPYVPEAQGNLPRGGTTARAIYTLSLPQSRVHGHTVCTLHRAPWQLRWRQPARGALVQGDRPGGLPAAERAGRPRGLGHLLRAHHDGWLRTQHPQPTMRLCSTPWSASRCPTLLPHTDPLPSALRCASTLRPPTRSRRPPPPPRFEGFILITCGSACISPAPQAGTCMA
jgi:hypothetical protein